MVIVEAPGDGMSNHLNPEDSLTVTVEVHNHGLLFGLSAQGDAVLSLLLANPIPRQQLNSAIFTALRPLLASLGPWNSGYGFRQENLQVAIQVTTAAEGLHFSQITQPHVAFAPAHTTSVVIEDISDGIDGSPQGNVDVPLDSTPVVPSNGINHDVSAITNPVPTRDTQSTETALISEVPPPVVELNPAIPRSTTLAGRNSRAPVNSANLRRSARANKYDGFRVTQPSDNRPRKSKVKPRVIPSAPGSSSSMAQNVASPEDEVPPPTPITDMQVEGIQLCAIPEEELTTEALHAVEAGPSTSV